MFGAEEDRIGGRGRGVHGVDRRLCSEAAVEFDACMMHGPVTDGSVLIGALSI